jgi:hypothetical protein
MPLSNEVARSLTYLRKRYKVSERDLVALAKKLEKSEEPEESWEEIVQKSLKRRKQWQRK